MDFDTFMFSEQDMMKAVVFTSKGLMYLSLFIILVNILFYKNIDGPVQPTNCTEGKCKNACMYKSKFCYWHDPIRRMVYPLGSEMTPRRSQRIAAQKGGFYTLNID